MATAETKTTEKKVVAPKAKEAVKKVETKVEETLSSVKNTATKVTTSVSDATKSSLDTVKDAATKVADAAKSSVDTIKDTYTDVEIAITEARASGNARAKKILNAFFNDKANDKVANFVGYIGETSAVCATISCAPMALPANKINTLYKKITA
jgi:phage-related protein